MKVSYNDGDLIIRMNKWDYRIYITSSNFWKVERRKIGCPDTFNWEDFNQILIPKSAAKEAIRFWEYKTK